MTHTESTPTRVLIVDDEPDLCELLAITLDGMGLASHSAGSLAQARAALTDGEYRLCLCDLRLPDGSGLDLIEHIQHTQAQLPIAIITAHGDVEAAVDAMKAGAFDFVNKPVNLRALRRLVDTALRLAPERQTTGLPQLIGDSPAMQALRTTVAKLARSQAPVFIRGESGVGKERVARLIHAQGPRANGPFVPVNCGALPEQLLESELFGHVKGSFTGAGADRDGLFQSAAGGTLFLDEIGAV
ncbi:MAG TPA: sigma-54-dependent Fis family transcriptional regulator, partial [Gammaproteobacteria bacterium]|nr:sigma-54-dependent Fis family transcriptional regulator [Gammaproteobacteria bacterium]